MVEECFQRLIERPSGLSGYRPEFWCAVCGKKTTQQPHKKCCGSQNCDNLCHERCMGEATDFKCGNTGELRALAGISDPVSFFSSQAQEATAPPPPSDQLEDNEDDLNALQKEELQQLVRNLRRDLATTKSQLTNYRSVAADLADKRSVLVEALSIVDTLLAVQTSEDIRQRSVSCTAKPHRLGGEVVPNAAQEESEVNRSTPGERPTPPSPPPGTSPPISAAPSPLPQPAGPAPESAEERERSPISGGDTANGSTEERETEVQHHHQQASRDVNRRPRRPKRKTRTPPAADTHQAATTQPLAKTQPRQKRNKCLQCNRWGHSQDQCQVTFCNYCQGRFHSSQNCRAKIADQRQQELVHAVRQSSQETLLALRGAVWQLQHPATHLGSGGPLVTGPHGTPHPQPLWPVTSQGHAVRYGAPPHPQAAML